jgi:hypothetical protein
MIQWKILIPCPMLFDADTRWVCVIIDSLDCRAMDSVFTRRGLSLSLSLSRCGRRTQQGVWVLLETKQGRGELKKKGENIKSPL